MQSFLYLTNFCFSSLIKFLYLSRPHWCFFFFFRKISILFKTILFFLLLLLKDFETFHEPFLKSFFAFLKITCNHLKLLFPKRHQHLLEIAFLITIFFNIIFFIRIIRIFFIRGNVYVVSNIRIFIIKNILSFFYKRTRVYLDLAFTCPMNWIYQWCQKTNALRTFFWHFNAVKICVDLMRFYFSFSIFFIAYRFTIRFFFDDISDFFPSLIIFFWQFIIFYLKRHLFSFIEISFLEAIYIKF